MSRLVPYDRGGRPAGLQDDEIASPSDTPLKDRIEAISKYVPAEILAFYVPAVPTINLLKAKDLIPAIQWGAFILAWLLIPIYFWWIAKGDQRLPRQILVSVVAFPIWAFVTNRELGPLGAVYDESLGLLLLLVFSLLTAFLLPRR